ncbi:Aste57867_17192 [Aphanomyces stellatus]|uniref:Aste57867_17192 protein n=1 Tax=Aphanomyces stellatus TaxID=120398 RepID=A0A485L7A8_9STRA|nr:hypothetical protein As57867_017133 [Aphanomyces stellatus]VFT93949.1 Aste57867_17192 [Aphanomyces stellatus]
MSLSQADFRRLLETPRVVPQGGGGAKKDIGQLKFGGKRPAEKGPPKDREKYKKFKKAGADGDNATEKKPRSTLMDPTYQGKYRDRAAERRSGANPDYQGLDHIDTHEMDAETTKFLGGDMKHTHLVKGLDLALLSQLKREKEKLQKQHAHLVARSSATAAAVVPPATTAVPTKTSALGSALLRFMKKLEESATAKHVSDLFLPGRLHYEFNVESIDVDTLPRFVQINKDDCPEPETAGVGGYLPPAMFEEVIECFTAKEKRRKKRAAMPPPPPPVAAVALAPIAEDDEDEESSDEDIFADVGDYVPPGEEDDVVAPTVAKGAIFKNLSAAQVARDAMEAHKAAREKRMLEETLSKAKSMYEKAEVQKLEREKAERLRKKVLEAETGGDYGECFPDYEEVEEDEEVRKKKTDSDDDDDDKKGKKTKETTGDGANRKARRKKARAADSDSD